MNTFGEILFIVYRHLRYSLNSLSLGSQDSNPVCTKTCVYIGSLFMILKHIQIWKLLAWGITLLIDDIFLPSFILSFEQVHQLPVLFREELDNYSFIWVSHYAQKIVVCSPPYVLFLLAEGYFTVSV